MSFSEPSVARLIQEAFVPVLISMHLEGPGRDDAGRNLVFSQPVSGNYDVFPPDLFVVSPDREILGRLPYDAPPADTLAFLKNILRARPDLAPPDGLAQFETAATTNPSDPAEAALRAIEESYNGSSVYLHGESIRVLMQIDTPEQGAARSASPVATKIALVSRIEAWLAAHADQRPDLAVNALILLGGARIHAGDVSGAHDAWRSVVERYPGHPLRHRAAYNLVASEEGFPSPPHPELSDLPPSPPKKVGVIHPHPELWQHNMEMVRGDPRYLVRRPELPFVRVPAGSFTMGGTPPVQARELPLRRVTMSKPFLISAWPVTNALWRLYRPNAVDQDDAEGLAGWLPAVQVAFLEAVDFCAFLSKLDGRTYRLPTEAEWEYASRGGLEGKEYPWGDEDADDTRCNFLHPRPVPVASYPANGYGLFDCVGNSHEWTNDYYLKDTFSRTPYEVTDPQGPTREDQLAAINTDEIRVVRGGGWIGNSMCKINCRNSWRIGWPQGFRRGNQSVRLVVEARAEDLL